MRKQKKIPVQVTVFCGLKYEGDFPPEDLPGFSKWILGKLAEIPAEYRDVARIEVTSHTGYYDSCSAGLEITYMRPETDEQYESRLAREREAEEKAEAKERRMLAELEAKYGKQRA